MASLGNDLAALRKKRDFSIEDVHDITKIPAQIIRSIENGSIQDRVDMNSTYARNYIRSYARAIGIDEAEIIKTLDRVQRNKYSGELLREKQTSSGSSDDISDNDISDDEGRDASQKEEGTKSERSGETSMRERSAASPPQNMNREEWDWAEVGRNTPSRKGSQRKTLTMIILLVILLAAAFLVYYFLHNAESSSSQNSMDNGQSAVFPNTHKKYYDEGTKAVTLNRSIFKNHPEWERFSR
jgi:cytoskeletal protein RodZ